MTFSLVRRGLITMALFALLGACGGSSSETPWPAEPLDLEPGPAGEDRVRGNVVDTKKLPDNYTKQQEELKKKKAEEKKAREKKQAAPVPIEPVPIEPAPIEPAPVAPVPETPAPPEEKEE